jgi:hypothetical protein
MEQEKVPVSPNAASMKNPTDNIAISRNQKPWLCTSIANQSVQENM